MDLSIDASTPIRSPSPATIASALVHCTRSITLTAGPAWGHCRVTRVSPTAVALDYYGPTGIRRAAPVTVALATTALQAFARGDHTWDREITWEIPERPPRLVVLIVVLILGVPIGGLGTGMLLLRDHIYGHHVAPRCQAYAVAHGDQFIGYRYDKHTAGDCLMAGGVVPVSATPWVPPQPGLWNVLYDHGWWIFTLSFLASLVVGSTAIRWWMQRSRR
jgi:hypothetical protein